MLTEDEAINLLWFIHKYAGTSQLRVSARITTKESYEGPVYEPVSGVKRGEDGEILSDEAIIDLIKEDDLLAIYFSDMGKKLLTAEEEVSLAQRIEAGIEAKQLLKKGSDIIDSTRKEKLQALVEDGAAARDHLIKSNARLAVSVAKKYYYRSGMALLDLIQEGNIGLMKGADKFNWRRGFRF